MAAEAAAAAAVVVVVAVEFVCLAKFSVCLVIYGVNDVAVDSHVWYAVHVCQAHQTVVSSVVDVNKHLCCTNAVLVGCCRCVVFGCFFLFHCVLVL